MRTLHCLHCHLAFYYWRVMLHKFLDRSPSHHFSYAYECQPSSEGVGLDRQPFLGKGKMRRLANLWTSFTNQTSLKRNLYVLETRHKKSNRKNTDIINNAIQIMCIYIYILVCIYIYINTLIVLYWQFFTIKDLFKVTFTWIYRSTASCLRELHSLPSHCQVDVFQWNVHIDSRYTCSSSTDRNEIRFCEKKKILKKPILLMVQKS